MAARGRVILYQETATAIRARIEADGLVPGDRVGPSLNEMAEQHGVGVATMREALKVLAGEGIVQTIQGKGTFVVARPAASDDASPAPGPLAAEVEALAEHVAEHDDQIAEIYARMAWPRPGRKEGTEDERDEPGGARRLQA